MLWPATMERGSGLGPALQACDLRVLGIEADAGEVWYSASRLPAMGDAKVPELVQLAHQHVLRIPRLRSDDAWMQFGHGFGAPAWCSWQGVYIDDIVSLGVARNGHRKSDLADCETSARRIEAE